MAVIMFTIFGTGIHGRKPAWLISMSESLISFMDFVPLYKILEATLGIETMVECCGISLLLESKANGSRRQFDSERGKRCNVGEIQ